MVGDTVEYCGPRCCGLGKPWGQYGRNRFGKGRRYKREYKGPPEGQFDYERLELQVRLLIGAGYTISDVVFDWIVVGKWISDKEYDWVVAALVCIILSDIISTWAYHVQKERTKKTFMGYFTHFLGLGCAWDCFAILFDERLHERDVRTKNLTESAF